MSDIMAFRYEAWRVNYTRSGKVIGAAWKMLENCIGTAFFGNSSYPLRRSCFWWRAVVGIDPHHGNGAALSICIDRLCMDRMPQFYPLLVRQVCTY
jgi:hypothetical protein